MSVLINSNTAATMASANLSTNNVALQRSLNRLSSGSKIVNPADDAGGLAVAMKFSAAAKRMGATSTNLANTLSYLQTQDGAMKVLSKVFDRISELKVYSQDSTKSAGDIANYNQEFKSLQAQITSIAGEKFNGVSLFGADDITAHTSDDQTQTMTIEGIDLLGAGGGSWSAISTLSSSDWDYFGGVTPSGGGVVLQNSSIVITKQPIIKGPYSVDLAFTKNFAANTTARSYFGGAGVSPGLDLGSVGGAGSKTVHVDVDSAGNASWASGSLYGSITDFAPASGGRLMFNSNLFGGQTVSIDSIQVTPLGASGSGSSSINTVASATDLGALDLSSVKGALQEVAGFRAQNGSAQSQLNYASDLLTANKANLEQATSRIMDVDVAQESTELSRLNVLVQAGNSMLSQANQSPQASLRLLNL